MKYIKSKILVDDITTKRYNGANIQYAEIDNWEYLGIEEITQQSPELEITELTYEEVKSILDGCRLMKELDTILDKGLREASKRAMGLIE